MDFTNLISQLTENQISIGGVSVLVIFIVLGVIKGIMRVILGFAGLVAAAVAFWFTFRHGDSVLTNLTDNPEPWMPLGLAGGAAVGAYTVARHGIGLIFKPMLGSIDNLNKRRVLSGIAGLGLGGAGLYSGGSASHQFDAMNFLNNNLEEKDSGWINTLLTKTQESWFGDFQQKTDPTKTAYRCDLIKALTLFTTGQSESYQKEEFSQLIQNQDFLKLAANPEISKSISEGDFQKLFRNPDLKDFISDADHLEVLQKIDWLQL